MTLGFTIKLATLSTTLAIVTVIAVTPKAFAGWLVRPTVSVVAFGDWGPDGIPFTDDDPPWIAGMQRGITSSFGGAQYNRSAGRYPGEVGSTLTAAASLTSRVARNANGKYDYFWQLTNLGTGDMVAYSGFKPQQLPQFFISSTNNLGGIELDGSAVAPFDLTNAPSQESYVLLNQGPPTIASWGGRWNPETDEELPAITPTPETSSTLSLLTLGTLGATSTLKRRLKSKPEKDITQVS